jgi:hypothetical protein
MHSQAEAAASRASERVPAHVPALVAANFQVRAISSRRVFTMNTILPQSIGAIGLISDGMAPIPYVEVARVQACSRPCSCARGGQLPGARSHGKGGLRLALADGADPRYSRPWSSLGFQVNVHQMIHLFPSLFGRGNAAGVRGAGGGVAGGGRHGGSIVTSQHARLDGWQAGLSPLAPKLWTSNPKH